MVKLTKIYTRGGDKGETSLSNGERVAKDDIRVEAYGAVDETNAAIGIACLYVSSDTKKMLQAIQNDLFDLGADLSTPIEDGEEDGESGKLRITDAQVTRLEQEIDQMNANLEDLTSFILPGGSEAASYLHLARTICRRAERCAITQQQQHKINPSAIKYLNRLSDLLFVLGRFVNDMGKNDVLWVPGGTR
ncbi:MAG: cob(I)yrinic acid a,c-diamide adenosyltransferase [Sphingomonadales bacterium]|nr:cob(I)yrinic acid a,c-diamide adenosyltransferase [Sphingomonadales bacterium]